MKKNSYLSYRSPSFVLGMSLLGVSLLNLFTLFTDWSIGPLHIYIYGGLLISIVSIVLGILYMYWNAGWEKNFFGKILSPAEEGQENLELGGIRK